MAGKTKRIELLGGTCVRGGKAAYHITKRLGAGANGVVYRAVASDRAKPVALKVFSPRDIVSSRQFAKLRRKFKNEVPKTRRASHWGVVEVLDCGTTRVDHSKVPFTVMEYCPRSLRRVLKKNALGQFARFFYSALLCETIHYINARGEIHRDIKPENLLFDKEGILKVADLGIAEFMPDFEARIIRDYGAYPERPDTSKPRHYFSPEQERRAEGEKNVDLSRSDCFQLGKVIHEILTGENPVGQLDLRDPRYRDVPMTVRNLLRSMLAQQPEQRPRLSDCAAVLYAEATKCLDAAYEAAFVKRRLSRSDRQRIREWFRKNDRYDPDLYRGKGLVEDIAIPMRRAGLMEWEKRKEGERGFYNRLALTAKGRDVRDMALLRQSLRRPMRLYKLLKRSGVYWPPPWGSTEWMSHDPRRRVLVEDLAFCQWGKGSWQAWVVCPPMHLRSGWWVEIYLGELPLPDHMKKGSPLEEYVEWLVPYCAPQWAIKGATVRQVLAKATAQLVKAGISRRAATKALAKFHLRGARVTKSGTHVAEQQAN
jgi:serine/threonine protein kinase